MYIIFIVFIYFIYHLQLIVSGWILKVTILVCLIRNCFVEKRLYAETKACNFEHSGTLNRFMIEVK